MSSLASRKSNLRKVSFDRNKDKLVDELNSFIEDAQGLLKVAGDWAGDQADEARASMGEKITALRSRLEDAQSVLSDKVETAKDTTETYVRDNPWATIGVAATMGLLVGMLLRSSNNR